MKNESKVQLRKHYQRLRGQISPKEQRLASLQLNESIQELPFYKHAKHIAFYYPLPHEIDLRSIWMTSCAKLKQCYFPKVMPNNTLIFLPATPETTWKKNNYGIAEPDINPTLNIPINQLDIMFLPLVAFDAYGTRLGTGGGYYDRTLNAEKPKLLIGTGYDFQHQSYIPSDPWDIKLHAIITPTRIFWSQTS